MRVGGSLSETKSEARSRPLRNQKLKKEMATSGADDLLLDPPSKKGLKAPHRGSSNTLHQVTKYLLIIITINLTDFNSNCA